MNDEQRKDLFERMTPDLVASELEVIAAQVRDGQIAELDVIHLPGRYRA